jgi:hypothetical protein
MTAVVPLPQLPSRTPVHPLRAAKRADPYWSSMWRSGSIGDWYSSANFRELREAGFVNAPGWLDMTEKEARRRVLLPRNREQVLRALAALDQWRTMTVQQLQALSDISGFTAGDCSLLSAMWNAGLVEICELGAAFKSGFRDREGILVRPTRPGAVLREFEESLTYVEWVSATAGIPFDADRQFARHNILATEFGLRVAEFSPAAMVLGEKLSTMDLLAYSGVGVPAPSGEMHRGSDLTIVREDGLRIAVEMTASLAGGSSAFYGKVERLVTLLSRRPVAETGLCFLMVVAPRRDGGDVDTQVMRTVKRAVQKAVDLLPGTATDPTAARIAVANWADLFPSGHQARSDFWKLPVERPAGRDYRGDPNDDKVWNRAFLMDTASTPFTAADPDYMKAVIGNGAGLRGVPHMLRRVEGRPRLNDVSLRRMGLRRIPQIEGTKDLTGARGVTGVRGLPPRLTY